MPRERNGNGTTNGSPHPAATAPHRAANGTRHVASGTPPTHPAAAPEPRRPQLPADLQLLSDREVVGTVRDLLREDGRIDLDELRITCRHGVVHVSGTLPSERELQIVRKLLTDVEGLEEIVDHVRVNDLPWERDDRAEPAMASLDDIPSDFFESTLTHDPLRAEEEGIAYDPPDEPPPDEE